MRAIVAVDLDFKPACIPVDIGTLQTILGLVQNLSLFNAPNSQVFLIIFGDGTLLLILFREPVSPFRFCERSLRFARMAAICRKLADVFVVFYTIRV